MDYKTKKEAKRKGSGEPTTLKERREKVKAEADNRGKEALTFGQYFTGIYYPMVKDKKKGPKEEGHFRLWIEPAIGAIPLKDLSGRTLTKERLSKSNEI